MEIEYTVLRCLARHPMAARRGVSEPHRKKITTLDGIWWPTGNVVTGHDALERDPGRGKALAYCHQCRVSTEYERLRP